jgi:hypothetical protein
MTAGSSRIAIVLLTRPTYFRPDVIAGRVRVKPTLHVQSPQMNNSREGYEFWFVLTLPVLLGKSHRVALL